MPDCLTCLATIGVGAFAATVVGDTADQGKRTLKSGDHVADGDVGGWLCQLVAAGDPARGLYQTAFAEARQNAFQERTGDAFAAGDLRQRYRSPALASGEEDHGSEAVFAA